MAKNCTYFDKDTSVRGELTTLDVDVIVEGSFKGKIEASGSVLLKKSVNIEADISTSKLIIEEGAHHHGHVFLTET